MNYRERVAIITGASSGIGRQIALDFGARGSKLVLVARRADRLSDVARACETSGAQSEVIAGDVGDRSFVESLPARALERFGRVDIVVNNAGVPKHKQIYHATAEELEYVMRVNFLAAGYLTLAALPAMLRQNEGYVVNISSVAGKLPPPRETIYAASKFAMNGFSEGLWLDLAGSNVHVGVINVGPVDTEIWEKTDEPTRYAGEKLPPSAVSKAVFRCIERREHELWVPGRMKLAWWLRVMAPSLFRAGAARYDPVPAEVVAEARARAENGARQKSNV